MNDRIELNPIIQYRRPIITRDSPRRRIRTGLTPLDKTPYPSQHIRAILNLAEPPLPLWERIEVRGITPTKPARD